MIRFLLHWQWLMMKRQLLTFQGMFPLIISILFQAMLIVGLSGNTGDLAESISMVVVYVFFFSLMQVTNVFSQLMMSASSGLLGVAPVPPRSKMVMVLVSLSLVAAVQALILSLGTGLMLMIHNGIGHGLVVMLVLLLTGFSLFLGLGSSLVVWLASRLPVKMRSRAGSLMGLMVIVIGPLLSWLNHHHPQALQSLGYLLLNMAAHPLHSKYPWLGFLAVFVLGLLLAAVPLGKRFSEMLNDLATNPATDGKTYKRQLAPSGMTKLFFWRDWVAMRRQRSLGVLLLFIIVFPVLFPGKMSIWWFGMIGAQTGTLGLNFGSAKILPLLYVAPISIKQLWQKRLLSLFPLALFESLLLAVVLTLLQKIHGVLFMLDAITLCLANIPAPLLLMLFFRMHDLRLQRSKKNVTSVTMFSFGMSFLPIVLGALESKFVLWGLPVNIAFGALTLLIGNRLFDAKPALQYLTAKDPVRGTKSLRY